MLEFFTIIRLITYPLTLLPCYSINDLQAIYGLRGRLVND